MKAGTCLHTRARFYAMQKLGRLPSIALYNCPDCGSTLSERTLAKLRAAHAAKHEPVLAA